jgi:phage recombination protein Bet
MTTTLILASLVFAVIVGVAIEVAHNLPEPVSRRGITEPQWRTLMNTLYPGAKAESVLMVWDYCVARKLDPLKRPCHIVPIETKNPKTGAYEWRDTVWPGVYELRATAVRTGFYLGHSDPDYGPMATYAGVTAPEWCAMRFYRWNPTAGVRAEHPVKVWFREVVAVGKDKSGTNLKANSRWMKAPVQMLTKCTEAAGLRETFPDEIGGESTFEEMDGQRAIDVQTVDEKPAPPAPEGFDDWLTDLTAVADEGIEALEDAFAKSPEAMRKHLTAVQPDAWEALKAKALQKELPF